MYEDDWSQWQPTRQTGWSSGLGGSSGVQNGQLYISSGDRSRAEARYYEEKAQQDENDYRQGRRQDYIQVQNSRATAQQKANEAANGGRTESMFTRPESEANWAELNGPRGDGPSKYLPQWMQRYNTGERWGGFQAGAAPLGDGGGGGELPSGIRESSYTTNGGRTELISNAPGGQIQRYSQSPDGSIHSAGMVNSQYSAFSGDAWRRDKGMMGGTAGGYAGLPTSQQPAPQMMPQAAPNVRNYGWDSTSGVEQDAFPAPYQMRGDYNHGRFENVTEEGYGDVPPPPQFMPTRHLPGIREDMHTSQLDGSPVKLTGVEPTYDTSWQTKLSADDEYRMRQELQQNNPLHFNPDDPMSDYDYRGLWQDQQSGVPGSELGANGHGTDKHKTPYHETFSNESKYAPGGTLQGGDAPSWSKEGGNNVLKDSAGRVVKTESDDELPHPGKLDGADEWAGEDESDLPPSTNEQIKKSINDRAEAQSTGNEAQDQEAELERQKTLKALDDYSKRGFLPGYRAEDGSRRPSDVSVYGNKRESGMVRRVGDALDDSGSSIASGVKQAFNRVKEGAGKVLDLYPPELSEDPRFTDVRTNVRSDGRMSRQEAMSSGDILTPQEQDAVERFKLRQILDQVEHLQSSALAPQNPRIAMDGGGRRDFNEDFNSTRTHDRATDPVRAGQIEAEMEGVKKSPRTGAKGDVPRQRPMTHRDVLAHYFSQALGGGIG